MPRRLPLSLLLIALTCGLAACDRAAPPADGPDAGATDGAGQTPDDALLWQQAGIDHHGYTLKLGHHGQQVFASHALEPAVAIERDGEPTADAQVWVAMLAADGETVLVEEQATTYEPTTDEQPAHYAQAKLQVPADPKEVVLRYRIEIPEVPETIYDVPIEVERH